MPPPGNLAQTAPPEGLSPGDWDAIRAQLPPSPNSTAMAQGYLKAANDEADDEAGYAVAISGDTVVVGAPGEDSNGSSPTNNGASVAGAAYVFVRSGAT